MPINTVWLNLPVKDIQVSKEFFRAIGFTENPMHKSATHLSSFLIGTQNFVLMLFPEETFAGFTGTAISDANKGSEMLINIDAESKEDVDAMVEKVRAAGGTIYAEPGESQGWMYAFGFTDPDGHRWSMLHMDMAKMPKN